MQDYLVNERSADARAYPLPYPNSLARFLLRSPLSFYRMGLGGVMNFAQIMVLTTRGRVSSLPRHTPIEYRVHGSKLYVVSAWGERPQWYQNLRANPQVTIQRGRYTFAATAQIVTSPSEAMRVLYLFRKRSPMLYDTLLSYLADADVTRRTVPDVSHQFTIVRFDPADSPLPLAPLPQDWRWFPWAGLALLCAALLWMRRR